MTVVSLRAACWPIVPGSLTITCNDGINDKTVTDNGDGTLGGDGAGTVDYDYGHISVDFSNPEPVSGTPIEVDYVPVEGGCADDCDKCKTHRLLLEITPGSISGQSQIAISDAWQRLFTKINRDIKPIHVEFITQDYEESYDLSIGHRFDVIPGDDEPLDSEGLHVVLDDTSW